MSSDQQIFIKQCLAKYDHKKDVETQLMCLLGAYNTLQVSCQDHDKLKQKMFAVRGTIPIKYQGQTYNIPIWMWIRFQFPSVPPSVYVTPTEGMRVAQDKCPHVDFRGVVINVPYLNSWKRSKSTLECLIKDLISLFGQKCPVYSAVPNMKAKSLPLYMNEHVPDLPFPQGETPMSPDDSEYEYLEIDEIPKRIDYEYVPPNGRYSQENQYEPVTSRSQSLPEAPSTYEVLDDKKKKGSKDKSSKSSKTSKILERMTSWPAPALPTNDEDAYEIPVDSRPHVYQPLRKGSVGSSSNASRPLPPPPQAQLPKSPSPAKGSVGSSSNASRPLPSQPQAQWPISMSPASPTAKTPGRLAIPGVFLAAPTKPTDSVLSKQTVPTKRKDSIRVTQTVPTKGKDSTRLTQTVPTKRKDSTRLTQTVPRKAKDSKPLKKTGKTLSLEDMQEEMEKIRKQIICPVCNDTDMKVTFKCGHGVCEACSPAVKWCPICRAKIKHKYKIGQDNT